MCHLGSDFFCSQTRSFECRTRTRGGDGGLKEAKAFLLAPFLLRNGLPRLDGRTAAWLERLACLRFVALTTKTMTHHYRLGCAKLCLFIGLGGAGVGWLVASLNDYMHVVFQMETTPPRWQKPVCRRHMCRIMRLHEDSLIRTH